MNSRIEIELAINDLATRELLNFARTVEAQGPRVEKSTKQAAKGLDDTTKAARGLEAEANKLDKGLSRTSREMGGLGRSGQKVKGILRDVGSEFGGLSRVLRASPYAAAAAGIALSTKAGADFSRAFGEVATIAEGSAGDLKNLRDEVLALSIELGKSPTEVSRALYQAISSGATEAADAVLLLEQALKLATAGLTSPEAAINGLTNVINAYGLEIERAGDVSDAFFTTVRLGKTRVEELAGSIGQVAPLASQLGVSYQELLAALAALTQQGLSTSEAFTQIRSVLVGLLKNGDDVDKALGKIGASFKDGELRTRSFASVLNDVRAAVGDSESALTQLFGRTEAVGGVLGLTGDNAARFAETLDGISNSAGATDKAFDTVAAGSGERLRKSLQNLKTEATAFGVELLDVTFKLKDLFDTLTTDSFSKELEGQSKEVRNILDGWRSVSDEISSAGFRSGALRAATERLKKEATDAGVNFGKVADQVELIGNRASGIRLGIELDTKNAEAGIERLVRDGLAGASGARRAVIDVGADIEIDPADFAKLTQELELFFRNIGRGFGPEIDQDALDAGLTEVAAKLDLLNGDIQGFTSDGSRAILNNLKASFEDQALVIRAVYDEIERGVEAPVTFNVDKGSIGDFPIPGQDDQDLRIEIPLGYKVDANQFEVLGGALRKALDTGLVSFEEGGGPKRLTESLIEASDRLPEGLANSLQGFFSSAQVVEFTDAAGKARRAAVDFLVETKDGVTTLRPDMVSLAQSMAEAQTVLERPVSVPIIEVTGAGIEITERYIATQEGLERALVASQRTGEDYASVIDGTKQALSEATAETLKRITEEARLEALQSRLLKGEAQEIAVIKARSAADQAAVARRVANGQTSVAAGQKELNVLREILAQELEVFRVRDEGIAGAEPLPRFIPFGERDNADALRASVGGLITSIVELGAKAAITARELGDVASSARIDTIELDLASPYDRELAAIEKIVETRLEVVRDNLKKGVISAEAASKEEGVVRSTADALRDQASASEQVRLAQEAASVADLEARAVYAELQAASGDYQAAIEAEIKALQARAEEEKLAVQARVASKEISVEQAAAQIAALDRLTEATVRQVEAELERRQALEGDDILAGFSQGLEDELSRFTGGAIGAEVASGIFDNLTGAAEAFGRTLSDSGAKWSEFRDQAIQNLTAIIAKALILKAVQAALGAFGFGGGVAAPAATSGLTGGGGGGGGAPSFRSSFGYDPDTGHSRFSPLGSMGGLGGSMASDYGADAGAPVSYFARGGIMPGRLLGFAPLGENGKMIPKRAYASGGIATSPQLAVFGEGRNKAEAFVPLPDGRSIPVSFAGGGPSERQVAASASVNAQIALTVNALDPRTSADVIRAQIPMIQQELTTALQKGTDRGFSQAFGRGGR